jgi:hypothetical protein
VVVVLALLLLPISSCLAVEHVEDFVKEPFPEVRSFDAETSKEQGKWCRYDREHEAPTKEEGGCNYEDYRQRCLEQHHCNANRKEGNEEIEGPFEDEEQTHERESLRKQETLGSLLQVEAERPEIFGDETQLLDLIR